MRQSKACVHVCVCGEGGREGVERLDVCPQTCNVDGAVADTDLDVGLGQARSVNLEEIAQG